MDVGMMMVFASYGWDNCPDDQVWDEEIRLARLAADSGFDVLWSAEHHFNDYSFVPDNLHLMAHLAAVCPGMVWVRRPSSCPGTIPCGWPRMPLSSTCCARASCAWAWAGGSPGASSPPSVSAWMNCAAASTRPRP